MRLVDTVRCVVCGQVEYQLSRGKSSRTFAGVCKDCKPALQKDGLVDEAQTSIPGSEPKSVSERNPRKG